MGMTQVRLVAKKGLFVENLKGKRIFLEPRKKFSCCFQWVKYEGEHIEISRMEWERIQKHLDEFSVQYSETELKEMEEQERINKAKEVIKNTSVEVKEPVFVEDSPEKKDIPEKKDLPDVPKEEKSSEQDIVKAEDKSVQEIKEKEDNMVLNVLKKEAESRVTKPIKPIRIIKPKR